MTTVHPKQRIIGVIIFYVIANVSALVPFVSACGVGSGHVPSVCCGDQCDSHRCEGAAAEVPSVGFPSGVSGPIGTCPDPCRCPHCPCHHGAAGRLLIVPSTCDAITPTDPHLANIIGLASDLYCPFLADIATPPPKV